MCCVSSGLADGLITSAESYRVYVRVCIKLCVIWKPQQLGGLAPIWALAPQKKKLPLWVCCLYQDLTFWQPCSEGLGLLVYYAITTGTFHNLSNKMQLYTVYLYLETAVHVSGGTSTHHQEHIQLYLQHVVLVRPLLLPAAIAAGSSNGVTITRCCR